MTGSPAPTPVSAPGWLAEIKARSAMTATAAHGYTPRGEQLPPGPAADWLIANLASAADVPALVAALEAVLELVARAEAWNGRPLDGWALNPAGVRKAIESALRDAQGGAGE